MEGVYTSETPLIEKVIRGEWGYGGAIQSDWFGTVSTAASILAGQDLEMPGPSIFRGPRLLKALEEGQVTEEHINRCARKMLEWIDRVTSSDRKPALTTKEAISVAREVASEGIVLLKNENEALPLDLTKAPKLAIVGQPAVDPPVGGGGSSLAPPQYVLKPLDFIDAAHPQSELVQFAAGVRCNKLLPTIPTDLIRAENGKNGVDVTYYNNKSPDSPVLKEFQSHGQVAMLGRIRPGLDAAGFRYELSTTLTPETTGNHTIGVHTTGAFKLFVDSSEVNLSPSLLLWEKLIVVSGLVCTVPELQCRRLPVHSIQTREIMCASHASREIIFHQTGHSILDVCKAKAQRACPSHWTSLLSVRLL